MQRLPLNKPTSRRSHNERGPQHRPREHRRDRQLIRRVQRVINTRQPHSSHNALTSFSSHQVRPRRLPTLRQLSPTQLNHIRRRPHFHQLPTQQPIILSSEHTQHIQKHNRHNHSYNRHVIHNTGDTCYCAWRRVHQQRQVKSTSYRGLPGVPSEERTGGPRRQRQESHHTRQSPSNRRPYTHQDTRPHQRKASRNRIATHPTHSTTTRLHRRNRNQFRPRQ